jgi:peptidoglycan/xylan/chitin deacetylase (PgdA/CDA1 family)
MREPSIGARGVGWLEAVASSDQNVRRSPFFCVPSVGTLHSPRVSSTAQVGRDLPYAHGALSRKKQAISHSVKSARVPILLYHSVSAAGSGRFHEFVVSPKRFGEQMAYLASEGYTVLTVSAFIKLRTTAAPERIVILTFDDGYSDFISNALPALTANGFAATIYVPTAYIGRKSSWLGPRSANGFPIVSWEQITQFVDAGMECGAHSHTHSELDALPPSLAGTEIVKSKEILEDGLQRRIPSFSYPYGYGNRRLYRMVEAAGYLSACAVGYSASSFSEDAFSLSRLIVTDRTDVRKFARLVSGEQLEQAFKRWKALAWRPLRRGLRNVERRRSA